MEENTQHFQYIMLYYFKRGKNATETQKKICAVYGEGAVTDGTCQKWFAEFCAGDLSLDDAPQTGRPVEVDGSQIKTLIENNQGYATREIADILKISKSIKLLVKMKNVSFILRKKLKGLFGQPSINRVFLYLSGKAGCLSNGQNTHAGHFFMCVELQAFCYNALSIGLQNLIFCNTYRWKITGFMGKIRL